MEKPQKSDVQITNACNMQREAGGGECDEDNIDTLLGGNESYMPGSGLDSGDESPPEL